MNEFELKVREIKDLQVSQAQTQLLEEQIGEQRAKEVIKTKSREKITLDQLRLEALNKFADEIKLDKRIDAIKKVYPEWDWGRDVPSTKTNYAIYTSDYEDEAIIPFRGSQALVFETEHYSLPVRQKWFIAKAYFSEKYGNQNVLQLNSEVYPLKDINVDTLDDKFLEAVRVPFWFSVCAFVQRGDDARYMNNVFT